MPHANVTSVYSSNDDASCAKAIVRWVERSDTHQAIEKIDGYRAACPERSRRAPPILLFVMNFINIKRLRFTREAEHELHGNVNKVYTEREHELQTMVNKAVAFV